MVAAAKDPEVFTWAADGFKKVRIPSEYFAMSLWAVRYVSGVNKYVSILFIFDNMAYYALIHVVLKRVHTFICTLLWMYGLSNHC